MDTPSRFCARASPRLGRHVSRNHDRLRCVEWASGGLVSKGALRENGDPGGRGTDAVWKWSLVVRGTRTGTTALRQTALGRAYCLGGYSRQATSTTTLVASRAKGAWSALLYMQGDQVVGAFCARRARPDSSGRPGQQYTPQCWRGNFVFLGRSSFSCGRKLSRRRMGTRRFCVEGRLAMTS